MRKYFKLITLLILVGIILSACNNGYSNKAITSFRRGGQWESRVRGIFKRSKDKESRNKFSRRLQVS